MAYFINDHDGFNLDPQSEKLHAAYLNFSAAQDEAELARDHLSACLDSVFNCHADWLKHRGVNTSRHSGLQERLTNAYLAYSEAWLNVQKLERKAALELQSFFRIWEAHLEAHPRDPAPKSFLDLIKGATAKGTRGQTRFPASQERLPYSISLGGDRVRICGEGLIRIEFSQSESNLLRTVAVAAKAALSDDAEKETLLPPVLKADVIGRRRDRRNTKNVLLARLRARLRDHGYDPALLTSFRKSGDTFYQLRLSLADVDFDGS